MGFFKIDRDLLSHYLWQDKPFSKGQAWIDLIGLARYEDGMDMYEGRMIMCERGKVYKSFAYLARRWGWSRKKVTAFIRNLERGKMVTARATTHGTTVTIVNYEKFQGKGTTNRTTKDTAEEPQRNSKGSKDLRKAKKGKERKEIKEEPAALSSEEEICGTEDTPWWEVKYGQGPV